MSRTEIYIRWIEDQYSSLHEVIASPFDRQDNTVSRLFAIFQYIVFLVFVFSVSRGILLLGEEYKYKK